MTWSLKESKNTYNIDHWSQGYFDISNAGLLQVFPKGKKQPGFDLSQILKQLEKENISQPCLLRFLDILRHRLHSLQTAFKTEIASQNYQGNYTSVYPIKVNQQRHVVEALLKNTNHFGLEAGSKPELMAVLALANKKDFTIICNGYKDREYIQLALIGKQLGFKVFIIIEKLSELELVIEEAKALEITPLIGLRVRLASIAAGNWQNTGGEKSKFGLNARQLIQAIQTLKKHNLLESLELLHTHMGSQISNIRDIQKGLKECAYFFANISAMGAKINYMDVGGGLGIDYEGSRSRNFCSINYSLNEYAHIVVKTFFDICHEKNLNQPNIITEAGRAMTAHHAVLLTPIVEVEAVETHEPKQPDSKSCHTLQELWQCYQNLNSNNVIETYHEAIFHFNEIQSLFSHGVMTMAERAAAENLFLSTCISVKQSLHPTFRSHQAILDDLNQKLATKIFCNFSVFQSLPDVWALDQVFPILPIKNLHQKPSYRGVIQDITCDSDGRIDNYIDSDNLEKTLPMPNLSKGDTLAIFLVGAYQETLGDIHNLFGDTHVVNIELDKNNHYFIESIELGDSIDELLNYVHYDINKLSSRYEELLKMANIEHSKKELYFDKLKNGLTGYTYLED